MPSTRLATLVPGALLSLGLHGCAGAGTPPAPAAPEPRIVQAGAPGEATRAFDGASVEAVRGTAYTEADVAFMQGMIHHHAQALEMTALIQDRTETQAIRQMGLRMQISQADEIGLMETWLRERGESVPEWGRPTGHGHVHPGAHGPSMPGMLSPEQMATLDAARGTEFDRLFLELMIQHHLGALTMVRDLYNTPGAAQESTVYKFASEVDADQDIEIRRMRQLLDTLREPPPTFSSPA